MDGFGMLRRLRGDGINAPVLFLTGRGAMADKICGLTVLAGGVVDCRACAGLFGPYYPDDRVGGGRCREAEPTAEQHHLRCDCQVGDVDVNGGHPGERRCQHQ